MVKKRSRKALRHVEKLWNTGRYWEWLDKVQAENLAREYPQELEQAWKTLTRKALRLPREFDDFCVKIEGREGPASLPDFKFLVALKRFLANGDGARDELEGLKGLSAPALMLRERALSWSEKAFPGEKLAAFLKTMAENPVSVTQRHYDQLAKVLAGSNLAEPITRLGALLRDFRQLNYQNMVKKGWGGIKFRELEKLDHMAAQRSKGLPESLRRIVLLPHCSQVAILARRLAVEGLADMARLVRCFEHLFPLVAGDRLEELNAKLMMTDAKPASSQSAVRMWMQIEGKPFEDKLMVLNRLRAELNKKAREEGPLPNPFSFFDDDLDDEHEEQLKFFKGLYHAVLDEIAERAAGLSLREQKELRRVVEEMLAIDWRLLVEDPDDVEEMSAFLRRLLKDGFAGRRMALVALLVAKRSRSSSLQAAAESVLDQSLPVDEQDLHWLLDEFEGLYFPVLRALAPVLDRIRGDRALCAVIFARLLEKAEEMLLANSMVSARQGFLSFMFGDQAGNMAKEFQTMRQELSHLQGFDEHLEPLRVYVSCFAKGHFTRDGFMQWLDYTRGRESWFGYLKGLLKSLSRRGMEATMDPFKFVDAEGLWEDQAETVLHFMKLHVDDFRTMDLALVGEFISLAGRLQKALKRDSSILVRINNILGERLQAGEKEAAAVQKQVMALLQRVAGTRTKAQKTRRGRR